MVNSQHRSSQPIRVVVIAGARSTEHEVSLVSSYNIVNAIDKDKYEVFVVGIDKKGVWRQYDPEHFVEEPDNMKTVRLVDEPLSGRLAVTQCSNAFHDLDNGSKKVIECDVVFPAVLGSYAEDGTMQGLLRMMDVPFTTSDVLGSAVGMDKDIAYRLLREAGVRVARFEVLRKGQDFPSFEVMKQKLETETIFIKPANAGSSVGVSRVEDEKSYAKAIELAFYYDVKIIAQAGVVGRELEIGVIGNIGAQRTSHVGEIIEMAEGDFYSYDNKYIHSQNVELVAPALLDDIVREEIKRTAIAVNEILECEGFSRVDFFLTSGDEVFVNEINTMPGFTAISMFPRLWQESGLSYTKLIDTLLEAALARHEYRVQPIVTDAADILRDV